MDILTRRFLEATLERSLKTFCQTFAAVLIAAGTTTVFGANWAEALGAALLASMLSVLTSIASSGTGGDPGPSAAGVERLESGDG